MFKCFMLRKPVMRALIMALAVAGFLLPALAQDLTDNAALYYWKAIGAMRKPLTAAQFETLTYIRNDFAALPPRVLVTDPDMLRWLLSEQPMLAALADGARITACVFPIARPDSPSLDLQHLPEMRNLTQRALAAAKAYEFAGNPVDAGNIYANLLRMILHLSYDKTLYSDAAAAELLQLVVRDLEGFIARDQPRDAFDELLRCFDDARESILRPSLALREERVRYTDWLLANPAQADRRLDPLYGAARSKPAVERLMTLDPKRKEARLREWLTGYGRWMDELADAFDQPYRRGMAKIRELDAQRLRLARDPTAGDNPLIPLLGPDSPALYQKLLLAEAQFDMADILCLAAAYRAETRNWPDTLDDIRALLRFRHIAQDPFSGGDFSYRLVRGSPVLITRVPKWMASDKTLLYDFNIGRRIEHDRKLAENAIKQLQRRIQSDVNRPVPMR